MSCFRRLLALALIASSLVGCQRSDLAGPPAQAATNQAVKPPAAGPITSAPLAVPQGKTEQRFELLAPQQTGIYFVNVLDPEDPKHYLYHSGTSCGGVAIGDVDGDGRPDVYLLAGLADNKLYRQVDDLVFEDITDQAGVVRGLLRL